MEKKRTHLRLVHSRTPASPTASTASSSPSSAPLKGKDLHRELAKLPTVNQREQLIIENLRKMGF